MSTNNEIPVTMNALVKSTPTSGYSFIKDYEVPTLKHDEILVKVELVGICGSDIHLYKWDATGQSIASLPFIPGHEMVGIVVKAGSDETEKLTPIGSRVCCENHFYCGECALCLKNRGDICLKMSQYGHGKGTPHGGCSQYTVLPARYAYVLKRGITPEQAVLLEPMGVAHNALERTDVAGNSLLVTGCGSIGLLAIATAAAMGATKIYAADVVDERLELAKKMGAHVTINTKDKSLTESIMNFTDNVGVDCIVEASGSPNVISKLFENLRKGGSVTLVGLPKSELTFQNPARDLIFKSMTINSVHGRKIFHTWEQCENLIADGKVNPLPVISNVFSLNDFQSAFDTLLSSKGCKILIDPRK